MEKMFWSNDVKLGRRPHHGRSMHVTFGEMMMHPRAMRGRVFNMTYEAPTLKSLDLSASVAGCCSPFITISIGNKIFLSDCNIPIVN